MSRNMNIKLFEIEEESKGSVMNDAQIININSASALSF